MKKISVLTFLISFASLSYAQNSDSTWFLNNYSKIERYIPMRDGVRLFTSIYYPKDEATKHPILMTRTPYSCAPYGEDKYIQIWNSYKMAYAKEGFIFVTQDVRGRYMSEGTFEDVRPFIKNKKPKKDIDGLCSRAGYYCIKVWCFWLDRRIETWAAYRHLLFRNRHSYFLFI